MEAEEFWIPKENDLANIDIKDLEFIFSQAEKNLSQTFDIANSIATKTYALLGFISTVTLGISGYIFKEITKGTPICKEIPLIGILVYLFLMLIFLRPNIFPQDYSILGTSPEELLHPKFFQGKNENDINTKHIYINEVINYKFRIKGNEITNNKRWRVFTLTGILFACTPLFFLLIGAFTRFFI